MLEVNCLLHQNQFVWDLPIILVRGAVAVIFMAGIPVAQYGALRCDVCRVPKGGSHMLKPFRLSLFLADTRVCFQDSQQGALRIAVQEPVSLHALDLILKPGHVRLHVVSRVLPRPNTNRALAHGRLAAVDALQPFGKDNDYHLCLQNPLCDHDPPGFRAHQV